MKKHNPVIILGSSNSQGDTYKIVSFLNTNFNIPIIDLGTKNISEFDYEHKNRGDDFIGLMKEITNNFDTIILATPIYWYTMSAKMKIFLDRFSDLLKIQKPVGRKLRGMNMAVVSCGSDKELKEGFHMPFKETANYLGMNYVGDVHTWVSENFIEENVRDEIRTFAEKIEVVE